MRLLLGKKRAVNVSEKGEEDPSDSNFSIVHPHGKSLKQGH